MWQTDTIQLIAQTRVGYPYDGFLVKLTSEGLAKIVLKLLAAAAKVLSKMADIHRLSAVL